MATGAQCCCLVSLGPSKHRDAGLHSGKVGRDTPPLTESPLSPLLFPHNSAPLIPTAPHSVHPFRPWGWHSPDLQLHCLGFQNVMILLRQDPGGVSETSGPTLFEPLNLCLQAGGASGKEPDCQCRRHKRLRFHPWVGKIPWRRAWQPISVFLSGKSHKQRNLAGYSPWGHKESETT